MTQPNRVVGIDIAKQKADACIRALGLRLSLAATAAGERHIKGGRQELRNLLFMATLGAATQHHPILVAHYRKLRAKGKKAKVALVACMRKIITILNTMLARNQTWNPPAAPADNTAAAAAPA